MASMMTPQPQKAKYESPTVKRRTAWAASPLRSPSERISFSIRSTCCFAPRRRAFQVTSCDRMVGTEQAGDDALSHEAQAHDTNRFQFLRSEVHSVTLIFPPSADPVLRFAFFISHTMNVKLAQRYQTRNKSFGNFFSSFGFYPSRNLQKSTPLGP